jgi:hypothetical protein
MVKLNKTANIVSKVFSGLMLCALAAALLYYPANKMLLALAVAAYAAYLWKRPHGWLLVVPALLPALDFAPWTGWFFLEELDLVLLLTAAVAYWRLDASFVAAVQSRFFVFGFALVGVAFAIAMVIGVMPLTSLNPNSFANYTSNYNGLRIAKGFAWAAIFLPLLRAGAGAGLDNLRRLFVPGMLLGLTGACLAVVWERAMFPGLLNFASDYRPTAPFSAMHTGGAALDAYLAISFPFIAFWLIGAHSRLKTLLALLLLLLSCFAGMATFSRDVYLAYGVSGAVIGSLALFHGARRQHLEAARICAIALLLALAAYALIQMFSTSGYRGLAAALALLGAAVLLGGAGPQRAHIPIFAATATALALIDTGLFVFLGSNDQVGGIAKGPYLGFIISTACFSLAALALLFGSRAREGRSFAFAAGAFPCMALTTVLIAYHWGGAAALGDAALLVALAFVLVALNRLMARPLWTHGRPTLTFTFVCGIVFATLVPLAGSYYLGERFATVGDDFSVRLRHWSEAIGMMKPDLATSAFGMGLGRYPATYMWKNTHGEMPGTFSYEIEGGDNQFLRISGPQYDIGYGEVLRMLQHVTMTGASAYILAVDARRTNPKANLSIAICERWLLYPQNCMAKPIALGAADGAWHHYEIALAAGSLARPSGLLTAPTQLEISTEYPNASVDVDNVSLRDVPSGIELIKNGSFSYSNDYWFFSSDRNHFPWHVKNFAVNLFFEQGWLGLAAMGLLLCYTSVDLLVRALQGATDAAIYLAALAGVMVVGMFDSIFDVPRLTLLMFLVLSVANLRAHSAAGKAPADGDLRRRRRSTAPGQVQAPAGLMA